MRISISSVCAALLLGACTGKVPENGALIQGQATGLDPEEMITAVLFQHEGGVGKGVQTDTLRNAPTILNNL